MSSFLSEKMTNIWIRMKEDVFADGDYQEGDEDKAQMLLNRRQLLWKTQMFSMLVVHPSNILSKQAKGAA